MVFRLTPAIKGFITAIFMIAVTLMIDRYKEQTDSRIQYFVFAVYAAGIFWTIMPQKGSFGALFSQGFRCFIVVTLIMVAFTLVYVKMHPELAEEERLNTIEYYKKQGDKTPMEIEEIGIKAKKQYSLAVVSLSIFRYLIIGAALTAAGAAVLNRRN